MADINIREASYTFYYKRNAEGLADFCIKYAPSLPLAFSYSCQLLIIFLQSKKYYFLLTFNLGF